MQLKMQKFSKNAIKVVKIFRKNNWNFEISPEMQLEMQKLSKNSIQNPKFSKNTIEISKFLQKCN